MSRRPYVIRQGDYLTRLAFRFGFDADEVWNAPENEALRRARPNREMLAPGDVLSIPDAPREGPALRVGSNNRYRARVPVVPVKLRLRDGDQALANEPYRVDGLPRPVSGQSNGQGEIELEVPVTSREVQVTLTNRHTTVPVRVGDLDPPTTGSGARQRLDHLGYYRTQTNSPEDDARAIRLLQRERGLPETGELDPATRDALSQAHGS